MNLFDLLGEQDLGFGNLTEESVETKVPKKEKGDSAKKATGKKTAGKKTARKAAGTDFDIVLPVKVYARGFSLTIEKKADKSMIKVSELFRELDELGFCEVRIPGIDAAYSNDADNGQSVLYITTNGVHPDEENMLVTFKDGKVVVCDGMRKCELTPADFADLDEDEISVSSLTEKWCEVENRYKGCRMVCADGVAYPVFTIPLAESANFSLPADVLVNGEWKTLSEQDFSMESPTVKDVLNKLFGEDTPEITPQLYANLTKTAYFIGYNQKKSTTVAKGFSTTVAEKKTVQERFKLPLEVYIATFGRKYSLTPEDFNGNTKVSLDEIKEHFKPMHKIFGDTSRKLDSIYLKEENLLSLMFISGKKGAVAIERESYGRYELLRSIKEMREAIKRPFFHGTMVNVKEASDGSIRVESFPQGAFLLTQNDETGDIIKLKFEMKLPKIPMSILQSIIAYFRNDLENEAWVKICYNQKSQEYFLVKGNTQATRTSVNYTISSDGLINNTDIIQVMDVHSHNTMRAFFSMVDDADECYPGLFGVIGCLDQEQPEMRFRAGYEGVFTLLACNTLFEED